MDPKDTFKERYNEYLEGRDKQFAGSSLSKTNTPTKTRAFSPNKFYVLGIIAGLMIVGPVGAYLFLSNQIFQNATTSQISSVKEINIPKGALAKVGNTYITSSDIDVSMQHIMLPADYEKYKNDSVAQTRVLDQLILEREARTRKLSASSQEIAEIAGSQHIADTTSSTKNAIASSIAQAKLQQSVVEGMTIDYAFRFLDPQSPSFIAASQKTEASYKMIKDTMQKNNISMQQAYNRVKNNSGFDTRITITNNRGVTRETFTLDLLPSIFSLKKGELSGVIKDAGGAFLLIKVLDKKAGASSFSEWKNKAIQKAKL